MGILVTLIVQTLSVFVAAYLIPGVVVSSFLTAFVVAVVLGVLNALLKPVLIILTLPLTILTFGLFALFINVVIILLAGAIVPGFEINGFWSAVIFGLLMALINMLIFSLIK